jgi:hypothetical protein
MPQQHKTTGRKIRLRPRNRSEWLSGKPAAPSEQNKMNIQDFRYMLIERWVIIASVIMLAIVILVVLSMLF